MAEYVSSVRMPAPNRLTIKTSSSMWASAPRSGSPLIRPFRRVSIAADRTLMPAGRESDPSLTMSIGTGGIPKPLGASEVEFIAANSKSPQDWLRHGSYLGQRSNMQPPPIGSATQGWGQYDTVDDIMSRPKPLGPLKQWKTMAHHGGQFSPFSPVNDLYTVSRRSVVSPGPGNYGYLGAPDPALSTRGGRVGTAQGGKISTAVRETDADLQAKRGAKVPGPGHYDTDHLFGIHSRIMTASPQPDLDGRSSWGGSQWGGSESGRQTPTYSHVTLTADLEDTIFDQRLVMSRQLPIDALMRHGTTRYSRKLKDLNRPTVRKLKRRPLQPKREVMKELMAETARMEALWGRSGRREEEEEEEEQEDFWANSS